MCMPWYARSTRVVYPIQWRMAALLYWYGHTNMDAVCQERCVQVSKLIEMIAFEQKTVAGPRSQALYAPSLAPKRLMRLFLVAFVLLMEKCIVGDCGNCLLIPLYDAVRDPELLASCLECEYVVILLRFVTRVHPCTSVVRRAIVPRKAGEAEQ